MLRKAVGAVKKALCVSAGIEVRARLVTASAERWCLRLEPAHVDAGRRGRCAWFPSPQPGLLSAARICVSSVEDVIGNQKQERILL